MNNNSGFFFSVWMSFFENIVKKSVIYKWLTAFYAWVSGLWSESKINNWFKNQSFDDGFIEKSFFGKALRLPFTLLDAVRERYNEKLTAQKENSFIVRTCKYLLHNFLALNLRYIGVLSLSAGAVSLIFCLCMGGKLAAPLLLTVAGGALTLFPVNVTEYFKDSLVVKFIEALLGSELSFSFFYITKCGRSARLSSACFFGILCGIVSCMSAPVYAVLLLAGLLYVFAVLYKTEFGVFTVAFAAPIVPTMVLAGMCVLTGVSLVIKAVTSKKFTWKFSACEFFVMLMILVYLFSAVFSYTVKKSLSIWLIYAVFMGFYFVVVNTVKTKKQLLDFFTVLTLSALVVCLYGIMQYLFGWNVTQAWIDEEMFEDIKMRIYSTLENPNVLGEYILLMLPLAVGLMWIKKNALSKIFYAAAAVVFFAALILTFSRGCWIGLMLAAAVFVTLVCGKLWGLVLLVLPLVPFVLPESIINRFLSIGDMKDSSTSYRVYIWFGTFLMLRDFWLSGIGMGSEAFTRVYPFYSYSSIVAPHAHNMFLQLTVEIGVAGITVFVIILVMLLKSLANTHKIGGRKSPVSVMCVAVGSSLAGFLLQGIFDNCFYNYRVFMIFWLVAGAGVAALSAQKAYVSQKEVNALD